MRKTLTFQLVSSFVLFSTVENCSAKKDQNPKIISLDDKLYPAVNNMYTFVKQNLEDNRTCENLCSLKFAKLFLDVITARNESEQSINSVNVCLSKLFPVKTQDEFNFNLINDLKKISDEINKASAAPFVVMGNSNDSIHFSKLGKAFNSYGIEYAIIAFNNVEAKFFFSDYNVANNIFIDKDGNVLDKNGCYEQIKNLGNNVKCIVFPILRLLLKKESCFVHLGGFSGNSQYSLPMLFSLVGAFAYDLKNEKTRKEEKKENNRGKSNKATNQILKCREYLYSDDSLMKMRSSFLQSSGIENYDIVWNQIKSSFMEKNLNYESFGNEKIVFSSNPFPFNGGLNSSGRVQCNRVLDSCVKNTDEGFGYKDKNRLSADDDIVNVIFNRFSQENENRRDLQKKENVILGEIKKLEIECSEAKKKLDTMPKNGDIESQRSVLQQSSFNLREKKYELQEIKKSLQKTLCFKEQSLHITRLFKSEQKVEKISYKTAEGGNYILDVHGFGDNEAFCQYFEGGKMKDY